MGARPKARAHGRSEPGIVFLLALVACLVVGIYVPGMPYLFTVALVLAGSLFLGLFTYSIILSFAGSDGRRYERSGNGAAPPNRVAPPSENADHNRRGGLR